MVPASAARGPAPHRPKESGSEGQRDSFSLNGLGPARPEGPWAEPLLVLPQAVLGGRAMSSLAFVVLHPQTGSGKRLFAWMPVQVRRWWAPALVRFKVWGRGQGTSGHRRSVAVESAWSPLTWAVRGHPRGPNSTGDRSRVGVGRTWVQIPAPHKSLSLGLFSWVLSPPAQCHCVSGEEVASQVHGTRSELGWQPQRPLRMDRVVNGNAQTSPRPTGDCCAGTSNGGGACFCSVSGPDLVPKSRRVVMDPPW